MYLGIDSSTQSISALVIDPSKGMAVLEASVNFGGDLPQYGSPSGFIPGGENGEVHADPMMWLEAMDMLLAKLSEKMDLGQVTAIAGSGQQHGSVYLNGSFSEALSGLGSADSLTSAFSGVFSRKTSPIWMDTSTGAECTEITAKMNGSAEVCARSGSIAVERFTGPQIRRFSKTDPEGYAETSEIHLVSSFIASVISGKSISIDYGDGAGMNLMNLHELDWDASLLNATAENLAGRLPALSSCLVPQGIISPYFVEKYGFSADCKVCPFTGDNPASLVGMGATSPGQIVISLGTSDTFFAAMPEAKTDPQGFGHVFGNPAGGFMSLICFRNGSLAREALRDELGVGWDAFDTGSLQQTLGSAGKNLTLPFYGAEITPRFHFSSPITDFSEEATPGLRIRSLLEGQFLNMKLHSAWMGVAPKRIRLTGGAAQNDGIAQLVADVFQAPVERLEVANSAALGAALIAATAGGGDLFALQEIFCKSTPGSLLMPNTELAGNYSTALAEFEKLLGKTTHA